MEKFAVSERRACELNDLDRSSYRYEPRQDRDTELRDKLTELARQKPRFGYRRLGVLLEKKGAAVNHKRLFRVYQEAGLGVRRREKKRLERGRFAMPLLSRPNQEWSLDFVSDALANGRAIRALTVLDDFTRESPAIEVDNRSFYDDDLAVLERFTALEVLNLGSSPGIGSDARSGP